LVWLGFRAFALEVDALRYAGLGENMVACGYTHPKTPGLEQIAKLVEPDIGVRLSPKEFFKGFFGAHFRKG
jgi:hypothetical protein